MQVTHDNLPQAISGLYEKLDSLEKLIKQNGFSQQPESDTWFDLDELCNYLPDKPKKATIYNQVRLRILPYHKGGKKLHFLKSEIDAWLMQGKRKTITEIATEADKHS